MEAEGEGLDHVYTYVYPVKASRVKYGRDQEAVLLAISVMRWNEQGSWEAQHPKERTRLDQPASRCRRAGDQHPPEGWFYANGGGGKRRTCDWRRDGCPVTRHDGEGNHIYHALAGGGYEDGDPLVDLPRSTYCSTLFGARRSMA